MANPGDTSYTAGALIEQIMPDAVIAYSDAGVTTRLVTNEWRPKADTITVTKWNMGTNTITSADVAAHTAGDETTASYLNSDKATITLGGYTVRADLPIEADLSNADNPQGQIPAILGNGLRAKQDRLLNTLFDSFTTNAINASTAALTVDHLYEAFGLIDSQSDGALPLSGVLYPKQLNGAYGLSNDLVTSPNFTATDTQNTALKTARYGEVAGIDLYRSREFAVAGSAVKGGIFRKDALAIGMAGFSKVAPFQVTVNYNDIKSQWEYVAFMFGGVTAVHEAYGCELWTKYA